ncbi:putative efflux pump antibiotic resistance protein [Periconia macrospinosa]|uniref:Putative efflux pump antibiotic resistance protein n=1 Tax=Periconia macrospinosa TaxID=97972 RepID=A0A2V1DXP9_9PLEO|nr:putative efflux pump antibiotic resistance protein [Periconia macrospinosa]
MSSIVKDEGRVDSATDLENVGGQRNGISTSSTPGEQGEEAKPSERKPLSFHISFLAINMMVLMVSLDATALAVAIPVITQDLKGTTLEAFWASLSFLLTVAVFQPIYTTLSEVFGRIGPLYSTFAWFVAGSIIFATAQSMPVLIVGRIFQGIGAGGLDVLSDIILVDMTTLKERPMYLGLFAIPLAAGTIIGPIIGALFTEYATWRWLGWINLPISAVNFGLIAIFLRLKPIERTLKEKMLRLDWIGMLLFGVGCTAFASPLSWAGAMFPWGAWQTILPLIIGFFVLVVFGLYERGIFGKAPVEPIFPTRIFDQSTASITLVSSFFHGAVIYSGIFYLPLFFQAVYLETPLKSAVSILPLCCTCVGLSVISGVAVEIVRKYRWGIIVSWAITAVGCGLIALWDRDSSLAMTSGVQVLIGFGIGPFFSLLLLPIQASVTNIDDSGIAAGVLVSFRLFGGLISLSMCSTIFSNVFSEQIATLGQLPEPVNVLMDVKTAIEFVPMLHHLSLPPILMSGVVDAYRKGLIAIFLLLAGFSTLGFLTSFFIKEQSIESVELGRQQMVKEEKSS